MSARDWQIGYWEDGPRIVVSGHGLSAEEIQEFHDREWDRDEGTVKSEEVHLLWKPRVKRCSNYDGWGCDQEGEWHGHWFEVRRNENAPDTFFTIIGHDYPPRTAEATA